ncbi:POK19 protein, partial [Chaetorhynchus papuensis]|nr:POK19 protein [Chaetorhynchus papuensis]
IEHRTGIPHSPTGQAIVERTHQTLKRVLEQQKGSDLSDTPLHRLSKALFTINFLNSSFDDPNPPIIRHFYENLTTKFREKPEVLIKDPQSDQTQGPFP